MIFADTTRRSLHPYLDALKKPRRLKLKTASAGVHPCPICPARTLPAQLARVRAASSFGQSPVVPNSTEPDQSQGKRRLDPLAAKQFFQRWRIESSFVTSLFFCKINQAAIFLRKSSGKATSLRHKGAAMICFPRSVTRHLHERGILAINSCA
jgi:hypothetical protein